MQDYSFKPVAIIETPFREKFAIPRQAGIVSAAKGRVVLHGEAAQPECVEGLEDFSHLWLAWVFHGVPQGEWRPRVRPPRLGGNVRVGVFASRAPFRPNPIGLSVVKLDAIRIESGKAILEVSGVDMMDGTPILDIKPYIPYSDAISDASAGFAPDAPENKLEVLFLPEAEAALQARSDGDSVRELIRALLAPDPRPAYKQAQTEGEYGMLLYDFDLQWRINGNRAEVVDLRASK
ncbi:tRNA (N6-threonylcarbamoyladenosine(37)-N6)-methyltransferase TrmO [Solemya velum gill symbiont]|uniref:tRNA (N6-threonylcarbamoyladenosine(37)-N6)-methyltransferase TrmO n=1 Tax=Solemya velum gill symbiont TaxID=2340 RepID=UPI0009987F69|nr:tRNA (N6-threonylcarbamoyladenosine(37)-N6)-methyltransferase TrmO [Solemya velum gill symbiont]OOZ44919.1 tRNA (N6-threonylcarbamoyladenosine(37)-N6)-methyltransferase TrmO [Solemya velum gill symbiont]OOZ47458.1 tRNA (N6-threonylcarbamoyladenosine(37)-N6)-methyltransferase TrmO [Solemya velum gill symbiont]OOZ49927.1 tRNA (N6-threonylcarbamoyladenosine(37)-N6)-methyltransferase TrmO [Solemya velum gill symbiont]OOZ51665.1 tRNA (N6-threonylcarbamoyladenosine(37)-N6)-methyltransferase TrmO [